MELFKIFFYSKPDGSEPVKEFLDSIDIKMRAKILRTIELLANNGTDLREPFSKALGDGIFELRIQVGSDISRILYFFIIGNKVVLTNGFIKKTQKTPVKEIEKAKQFRKEYLSRREIDE